MSAGRMESSDTRGDDIDKANELAQIFTDSAIAKVLARSKPQQVISPNGEYPVPDCVDCGEPIIMARLQMGRIRCFDCQTLLERGSLH